MIICILIITHLLLDFTFQPSVLACKKKTSFKYLLVHSLIYMTGFLIVCSLFVSTKYSALTIIILSLSHFIVDWIRQRIELSLTGNLVMFIIFLVDQVIHISTIVVISYMLNLSTNVSLIYSRISDYTIFHNIVLYILLFTIMWDPASIFIKKLFELIFNKNVHAVNNDLKMGNLIGKLERLIVGVLLLSNQYGVVGVVLTAKSIARFKQLEDKDFAEKYLVGTLSSISIALVSSIIIKVFIL